MAIIESDIDALEVRNGKLQFAALFHALADPTRLLILDHLRTGEHKVRELTEHLGLAQSTVSAHLSCLKDTGLVLVRSQGRASIYSLGQSEALDALTAAASALLPQDPAHHHWQEAHSMDPKEG
ncbi:ArsR/SmtB family transcription factor [Glutamicibacter sp.]|uniref:ArsR/SmtB family transcription factor n=1 Tax=Glutamicibacter sp. TaxID=1931995 RepID=UPI003D6C23E9